MAATIWTSASYTSQLSATNQANQASDALQTATIARNIQRIRESLIKINVFLGDENLVEDILAFLIEDTIIIPTSTDLIKICRMLQYQLPGLKYCIDYTNIVFAELLLDTVALVIHQNGFISNICFNPTGRSRSNDGLSDTQFCDIISSLDKNTMLTFLDASECDLSSKSIKKLALILSTNSNLIELNLRGNSKIGNKGIAKLIHILSLHPTMKKVDLSNTGVTREFCASLMEDLHSQGYLLKIINN